MNTVDVTWARDWVKASAAVVAENRVVLIDLDRAIGDGDHGENLDRGYTAVLAKLAEAETATVGEVFALVAKTLMSTVGGAAGPLYGTAYLRAAKAAEAESLDAAGVADVLDAAVGGIVARGKAEVGEKTMVDAWSPAAEAARDVADRGGSAAEALAAAADAAEQGAVATEPLVAHKGRASYLGERSAGHRDPGAQSSALLLRAAADAARAAG
ncbi:MAG TPA: dihydroxyacetone kinase subunit L [Candidatus Ruania gallistercoris]|uniref:Dihydroxyacetone kinase subunit L n=1 Tax=Candidatus Ruania gallistercoris TaxID=2838746 RepID=A0A9D2J3Z5_9MICO|nr:dihydroxyacetone kinase subunit L [Candidatus Ruania gallistercoris]